MYKCIDKSAIPVDAYHKVTPGMDMPYPSSRMWRALLSAAVVRVVVQLIVTWTLMKQLWRLLKIAEEWLESELIEQHRAMRDGVKSGLSDNALNLWLMHFFEHPKMHVTHNALWAQTCMWQCWTKHSLTQYGKNPKLEKNMFARPPIDCFCSGGGDQEAPAVEAAFGGKSSGIPTVKAEVLYEYDSKHRAVNIIAPSHEEIGVCSTPTNQPD